MTFAFTPDHLKLVERICAKYPKEHRQSALLPLLDLAQRQNGGWLSHDALEAVANAIGTTVLKAYEVASFYTMFHLKPVGKYHIQVCGTTPCWLNGAEKIMHTCKKHLNIKEDEISKDGLFSLEEVECLGACVNAPVVQINDNYFEDLDEESMMTLIETCRTRGLSGDTPEPYSALGRHASEPHQSVKNDEGGADA